MPRLRQISSCAFDARMILAIFIIYIFIHIWQKEEDIFQEKKAKNMYSESINTLKWGLEEMTTKEWRLGEI